MLEVLEQRDLARKDIRGLAYVTGRSNLYFIVYRRS